MPLLVNSQTVSFVAPLLNRPLLARCSRRDISTGAAFPTRAVDPLSVSHSRFSAAGKFSFSRTFPLLSDLAPFF